MSAPKSVAKLTSAKAAELGVTFKDVNGDYVVNLDYGDILDVSEFTAATYEADPANEGILPPKRPK